MKRCELRKRFEWCEDVEPSCSAIIDKFDIDVDKSEALCKIISLKLLPAYRYLKYIENMIRLNKVPTEQLMVLKQLGLSYRDMADLLNAKEQSIKERFSDVKKTVEHKREVLSTVVELGTKSVLKSLESKWAQLNEMRQSPVEETQLKAMKLQIEVETLINEEKERALSMDRLKSFMSMMEDKVVSADRRLKSEIDRINKVLLSHGEHAIEYRSITRDIRRAIESDKRLSAVNDAISTHQTIDVSTERTEGEVTLID